MTPGLLRWIVVPCALPTKPGTWRQCTLSQQLPPSFTPYALETNVMVSLLSAPTSDIYQGR